MLSADYEHDFWMWMAGDICHLVTNTYLDVDIAIFDEILAQTVQKLGTFVS